MKTFLLSLTLTLLTSVPTLACELSGDIKADYENSTSSYACWEKFSERYSQDEINEMKRELFHDGKTTGFTNHNLQELSVVASSCGETKCNVAYGAIYSRAAYEGYGGVVAKCKTILQLEKSDYLSLMSIKLHSNDKSKISDLKNQVRAEVVRLQSENGCNIDNVRDEDLVISQ